MTEQTPLIKSKWKTVQRGKERYYSTGPHSGKMVGTVRGKGPKKPEKPRKKIPQLNVTHKHDPDTGQHAWTFEANKTDYTIVRYDGRKDVTVYSDRQGMGGPSKMPGIKVYDSMADLKGRSKALDAFVDLIESDAPSDTGVTNISREGYDFFIDTIPQNGEILYGLYSRETQDGKKINVPWGFQDSKEKAVADIDRAVRIMQKRDPQKPEPKPLPEVIKPEMVSNEHYPDGLMRFDSVAEGEEYLRREGKQEGYAVHWQSSSDKLVPEKGAYLFDKNEANYVGSLGIDPHTQKIDDLKQQIADLEAQLSGMENVPAPKEEPKKPSVKAPEVKLKDFIAPAQLKVMRGGTQGSEGQFFSEKMMEMKGVIANTPPLYSQDGKGDQAEVHLHYFKGGADWYITELDPEQGLAFGYADLGHGFPELGYVTINELKESNMELDLHWDPKTLASVKGKDAAPAPESVSEGPKVTVGTNPRQGGFDKLSMDNTHFREVLDSVGASPRPHLGKSPVGTPHWAFHGKEATIYTAINPFNGQRAGSERTSDDHFDLGSPHYVGIEGDEAAVVRASKIIRAKADYAEESKHARHFI